MLSEENLKKIEQLKNYYPTKQALLLPVLWIVQEQEGYVSEKAAMYVADLLNLSESHVLGVITFYGMIKKQPIGKNHMEVCKNISCMLRGSDKLIEHISEKLNIKNGQTTDDKKWTLSTVECMGACCNAPMLSLNGNYIENVTIKKVDELLDNK